MSHAEPDAGLLRSDARYRLFVVVKYLVYLLLSLNVLLFLREELAALQHTFTDGVGLGQFIQVFSASIDTAAWVVLLLLFELETWVLDDRVIRGAVKWLLHGVRALCYLFVGYAFTGYYSELVTLYQVTPLATNDLCSLLGQDLSLLVDLDEYLPLGQANCVATSGELFRLDGFSIVVDAARLEAARWLAWTDVINAATWILVVVVLEVEVRLQLKGKLSGAIMEVNRFIKLSLYGVLFLAAAYWGYAGDFLDFWDAFLWLFAFIFIEMNVFEWQSATEQEAAAA